MIKEIIKIVLFVLALTDGVGVLLAPKDLRPVPVTKIVKENA